MLRNHLVGLIAAAAAVAAEPRFEKTDLFIAGDQGYALYRIPGIVATAKGTLLAYAEARKSERGDWGPIDLVMRRSTDGGKSWLPQKTITKLEGPHTKNPVALAQNLAGSSDVTFNNPVAIADRNGGVHFVYCLEYMRAFSMKSEDDGRTFSRPVEITAAFEAMRPTYDWKVIATGPGHGIQLRNGRLVVPVWLSTGTGGHAHRPSVVSTIYSDDSGRTWKIGAIAVPNTEEFVYPSEAALIERSDGSVLLNARSETKRHRRIVTTSRDGATNWSSPVFDEALWEPICMASLLRLPSRDKKGQTLWAFSNPHNLDKLGGSPEPGKNRDRRNLTVQLSADEGKTWIAKRSIEPGWSGYSDLAATRNGDILCLYERGGLGDDHFRTAALTLARLNLEWIKEK